MTKIEGLILNYVEYVAKADIGPMNVDQQETDKAMCYHWETPWGEVLIGPRSNVVQSFSVTVEDTFPQKN